MAVSSTPPSSPAASLVIDPERLARANINPATGLATDFLNHFNEAVMLLEMMPAMPECKADLLAWRPKSYEDHFATSGFKDRDLAIAAYRAADPKSRLALDALAARMNRILQMLREAMTLDLSPEAMNRLASEGAGWLKPLVAAASAVINGSAHDAKPDCASLQDAIDALFEQGIA